MRRILLILLFLSLLPIAYAISSCGTLSTGLNTLTADVSTTATCFTAVSNSILDCNGHKVTGNQGSSIGYSDTSHTNIDVRNCNFFNLSTGVQMSGSSAGNITANNITNSSMNAINLISTTVGINITKNFINSSFVGNGHCIQILSSTNLLKIDSNTMFNCSADGIRINNAPNINITNNNITFTKEHGIWADGSSNGINATNDIIMSYPNNGLYFQTTGDYAQNDTLNSSANMGIYVTNNGGTYVNNTIINVSIGIRIEGSNNVFLGSNISNGAGKYGFFVNGAALSNNNLTNSIAYNLSSYGMNISEGTLGSILVTNFTTWNTTGIALVSSAPTFTFNGTNLIFDNPAGGLVNYTNISMNASLGTEGFAIGWSATPAALPDAKKKSLGNAWINISQLTGSSSINSIIWNYLASNIINNMLEPDLAIFKEASGPVWTKLPTTVDTNAKALAVSNVVPTGVFGPLTQNMTLSLVAPSNGATISNNNNQVSLSYATGNDYTITCNTTLDTSQIDNRNVPASGSTQSFTTTANNGGHTWNVICYDAADQSYNLTSATNSFTMNFVTFQITLNLTNGSANVLSPQRIWYDTNGSLYSLFFSNNGGVTDNLSIANVTPNNSLNWLDITPLNSSAVKDFFLVIREPANYTAITYLSNNTTITFIEFNKTTILLQNVSTALNAVTNNYYDPFAYANTMQFPNLTLGGSSYYLYWLPTTTDSRLMSLPSSSYTFTQLNISNHNRKIVWQTIANSSDLSKWYFAAPYNTSCTGTTDNIGIWFYNGVTQTLLGTPDTTCYNQAAIEASKVLFQKKGNFTYVLLSNITNNFTIYRIEDNKTFQFNSNVTNPSNIFFVDQDTFVLFSSEAGDTVAYACWFNPASPNCQRIPSAQYGTGVTYVRGPGVTFFPNATSDLVAQGTAANNGNNTQFIYTIQFYDMKFLCYDEISLYRKNFTVQVFTNNFSQILTTPVYGYVSSSSLFSGNTQYIFSQCSNGTQREYISSLGAANINFYSLNTTLGVFCTFIAKDQFGNLLQNATMTAQRFSNDFQHYVTVQQAITDVTGSALFFLQPGALYQMSIMLSGYLVQNFPFQPICSGPITLVMNSNSTSVTSIPGFNNVLADISWLILPNNASYFTNDINITYQISSQNATLQYFGWNITKLFNGTTTTLIAQNITNQPAGGTLNASTTGSGQYAVTTWWKSSLSNVTFYPATQYYTIGNAAPVLQAGQALQGGTVVTVWTFYLITVVCAMIAAGFVARYSVDGAGIAGLAILWGGTILFPGSLGIPGLQFIDDTHVTILTTAAVVAALVVKNYL